MIELVLRVGISLFVVLGLMWAMARIVRRPLGAGRHHGPLSVLNRQQLTRGAAVTILRVGDRAMILGVTDAQISLLGEADLEDFEQHHHAEHRNHLQIKTPPLTEAELAAELAAETAAATAADRADHHPDPSGGHLAGRSGGHLGSHLAGHPPEFLADHVGGHRPEFLADVESTTLDLPGKHPVPVAGRLDGSLLSPRTWSSTMNFLRDRTTRR